MQGQLTSRVHRHTAPRSLHRAGPQPRPVVVRAGLFSFLAPKPAVVETVNPRANEIVEELVDICTGTDAGAKASTAKREQIAELVDELQQYCINNPLKSKLLWGEYEVLYASKPTAVGGPLKSAPGQVVFPGQKAKQILTEPDQLVNLVEYKTLGFINGYNKQFGTIRPISGDTFLLDIDRGELNTGVGPAQQREFNIQRRIQIAYLDDTLRVARFLPSEDLSDDEAGKQRSEEEIIFVFRRVVEGQQEEEEEQVEEEAEEEAPRRGTRFLFGAPRTQAGLATVAERDARARMQQEARASRPSRGTSISRRQQAEEEEEVLDPRAARAAAAAAERERRAAAEAEKRRAAEEERERKRREAEERAEALRAQKEREAAEREAQRERQAAIKELLASLQNGLREKSAAAKQAAKEVAELRRSQAPVLKQVEAARQQVEEAEQQTQAAAAELVEVTGQRKQAEQVLKQSQGALKEAEKEFRKKLLTVK